MLNVSKIAFIGSGAMGEAMIKGLLAQQLLTPDQIIASDPVPTRRELAHATYGIQTTDDNRVAVRDAQVVLLCVKPQAFGSVAAYLRGQVAPDALIISIMAGVTFQTLQQGLEHARIVRSMPNTPAQ